MDSACRIELVGLTGIIVIAIMILGFDAQAIETRVSGARTNDKTARRLFFEILYA